MPSQNDRRKPPATPCPTCTVVLDSVDGLIAWSQPAPGDASICWHCRTLLIFDQGLKLRLPTRSERIQLEAIPDLIELQRLIDPVRLH